MLLKNPEMSSPDFFSCLSSLLVRINTIAATQFRICDLTAFLLLHRRRFLLAKINNRAEITVTVL